MPSRPPTDALDLELVDDVLTGWRSKRRNTPATPAARAAARLTVVQFARWLAANRPTVTLWTAARADCQAWLDHRLGEVKARTVAKNWSELRAFYTTAETDPARPLDGNRSPMAGILMPAYVKNPSCHAATPAEVDALIARFDLRTGLGLRNAAMVWLMFGSGLRVGEVAAARLEHLDLDARTIHLPVTKTLEERVAPLHPDTITLATRYLRRRGEQPGPLFVADGPRATGSRMSVDAVKNVIKRASTGTKVSPHSLRRGFAVEWLANGGDAASLMIICGWKSEAMIVNYLGNQRARTAHTVFDAVIARQIAGRRRLRAVN